MHAVFDRDRKGNIISGIYEEGTHRVVPVENCLMKREESGDYPDDSWNVEII